MEWLTNLLGFANQGTSPFGSLGGAGTPGGTSAPPISASPVGGAPAMPGGAAGGAPGAGGMQLPGLLGKLMGQQQQPAQPGQAAPGAGASNPLFAQALKMLQPPQMQPAQMNLLSGPRG